MEILSERTGVLAFATANLTPEDVSSASGRRLLRRTYDPCVRRHNHGADNMRRASLLLCVATMAPLFALPRESRPFMSRANSVGGGSQLQEIAVGERRYVLTLVDEKQLPVVVNWEPAGCQRVFQSGAIVLVDSSWRRRDVAMMRCPKLAPRRDVVETRGWYAMRGDTLAFYSRSSHWRDTSAEARRRWGEDNRALIIGDSLLTRIGEGIPDYTYVLDRSRRVRAPRKR